MDVSVIIVNYNTLNLTEHCIQSIFDHTQDLKYEVILVDNASSDGSVPHLRQKYHNLVIIELSKNIGFGKANNEGLKVARGKYVLFLNSDTVLISNAIKGLWDFMERNDEQIGVCGAQLLNPDLSIQASFGNFPSAFQTALESIGFRFIIQKFFYNSHSVSVNCENPGARQVCYVSGADMLVRKKWLDKFGGFDPDFFMYYEETELCYRLAKNGIKSYLVPEYKIIHLGGQSIGKASLNKFKLMKESELKFLKKKYGGLGYSFLKPVVLFGIGLRFLTGKLHRT